VPGINDVVSELQFISDRISTQVRTVGLGLLAITWAILVGESAFLRKLSEGLGRKLLFIGILCIAALLLDFLQYVIGYAYVDGVLKRAESQDLKEIDYDTHNILWISRSLAFWVKQVLVIAALVFFLQALARYLYS
jgi:hypothetical protein